MPSTAEIGAAPAGYGLGAEYATLADHDDADYIYANGWYYASYNTPDNTLWTIEQVSNGSNKYQTAYKGDTICYRSYYSAGGYWNPWEWVNPPMDHGVVYRTTERYNGHPVYVVTLSLGNTRDAGFYSITAQNVEVEYPYFTVIDVSAVCLDAESTKEIGCYYNAIHFFEYISVCTAENPLRVYARRNDYYDYNGVIFETAVTIKFVRADLDSAYA